jgi:hypothetical protein
MGFMDAYFPNFPCNLFDSHIIYAIGEMGKYWKGSTPKFFRHPGFRCYRMHTSFLVSFPATALCKSKECSVIPVNISFIRHPDVRRDPDFPLVCRLKAWVPAIAGMTEKSMNSA